MSAGHIRQRGLAAWEVKFDVGRDPATGRRLTRFKTVHGSKRNAQRALRDLLTAVDKGVHVEPSKLTVAEYVRARVNQWEAGGGISARTAQRYRQLVENQIVPFVGDKMIQKLKRLDIESWHSSLRSAGRRRGKGGIAARTIGHAHRVLSKALSDALSDEFITRNACTAEAPPRVTASDLFILRSDEIAALLASMAGHSIGAPAMVALFTGMRLGEILALRWSNVDLDKRVIYVREALEETKAHGIRSKPPKTKRGRRDVSLPTVVVETLREHRRKQLEMRFHLGVGKLTSDALLFATVDGAPLSSSAVSREWGLAAITFGRPDVTFHGLRHTHASQLIDAGVDVVTISTRLGHASPTITLQVYAHLFRRDDSKAAEAINAAFDRLSV